MEKITGWETTTNRFVCLVDIMGFKDRVQRNSHERIYNELLLLSKAIDDAKIYLDIAHDEDFIRFVTFSDSVFIFTKDDSKVSFNSFIMVVSWIMADSMKNTLPLKGAIAHGLITIDKERNLYFGQPIIDAYILEQQIHYYGVVFHSTAFNFYCENSYNIIPDSALPLTPFDIRRLIIEAKTPLKSGSSQHLNIDWATSLQADAKSSKEIDKAPSADKMFELIIMGLRKNTSGLIAKYIDNTEEFFNKNYSIAQRSERKKSN